MDVEAAISIADTLIFQKTGKHLDTLQTNIFRSSWLGEKYEKIAEQNYCSDSHIKMLGANLWENLSIALNEKVTKKNFRAVLERQNRTLTNFSEVKQSHNPTKLLVAPKIELELPEGRVPLGSPFYVKRPNIEHQCDRTILKPGALIRIKAPRQMGKSSLMVRAIDYATQAGYHTVTIDFQLADRKIFEDFDLFLKWFCISITRKLALPNRINEYWDDIFGSKMSCKDYVENYLLTQLEQPLVLALEEVDLLFQYAELADDFFALLRSWHEEAKSSLIWQKLRLIIAHSTEVYIPLNINQSPFNVGLPLELTEFRSEQILDLAIRHGLDWNSSQVEKLVKMVGGHPFLVRIALYNLAQQKQTLEQLFAVATTETSPFNHNLRRHLWQLRKQPELARSLKTVLTSTSSVRLEPIIMFKLHSMGLVRLQGNEVTPRCELYRLYFKDRLQNYDE
ncbi:MAG: AAA-like domain-containing protein [Cyanobacteria bacterium P01_C01_bin.72]